MSVFSDALEDFMQEVEAFGEATWQAVHDVVDGAFELLASGEADDGDDDDELPF
jgi:hypothetical protein